MPSVPIVDAKGKSQQTLELSADVFGVTPRVPLLHQAVVKELAARRAGTHSTRGRSDVRGGGGKPFGPRPRKYDKAMPSTMRRAALREAVAAKLGAGHVSVVDTLGVAEAKTKALTTRLKGLGIDGQPTLLVVAQVTDALTRAARNVPWLSVELPGHTSVYQVIRNDRLVFEKAALLTLQETLKP